MSRARKNERMKENTVYWVFFSPSFKVYRKVQLFVYEVKKLHKRISIYILFYTEQKYTARARAKAAFCASIYNLFTFLHTYSGSKWVEVRIKKMHCNNNGKIIYFDSKKHSAHQQMYAATNTHKVYASMLEKKFMLNVESHNSELLFSIRITLRPPASLLLHNTTKNIDRLVGKLCVYAHNTALLPCMYTHTHVRKWNILCTYTNEWRQKRSRTACVLLNKKKEKFYVACTWLNKFFLPTHFSSFQNIQLLCCLVARSLSFIVTSRRRKNIRIIFFRYNILTLFLLFGKKKNRRKK